jgi:hypothetical protein
LPARRHGRLRGVSVSVRLLPAVRDLIGQHPRAGRLSSEQVAGLLWILRYVPDEDDAPPSPFEVADALEVLDVERGRAA